MLPDPVERPLLSVDEARHALGDVLGRSAFYAAVERGEVPGLVSMGRRRFLSTAALRRWVGVDEPGDDYEADDVAPLRAVTGGASP